ncbi:MAG: crossover junction endodeoxyribonuclease RuvC [Clostridia bacterium]|nr:crossover junction endodeoxyribonuclease RuvC [Clostridia bacterium]
MIVLGIDPGYGILGYGLVWYDNGKFKPIEYGTITTPVKSPITDRLPTIYSRICGILDEYRPNVVSIEKLFYGHNQTTVIDVAQARGCAILAAAQRGIEVREYTPMQIKQAVVGYGRAEKRQVQYMVTKILNLESIPKPDDAADALAIAICHCQNSVMEGMLSKPMR